MITLRGVGASSGIAIGKVFMKEEDPTYSIGEKIESIDEEILRLDSAISKSIDQLNKLYNETRQKVGEKEAEIFEAHSFMLQDEDFIGKIKDEIKTNKVNAEYAVEVVKEYYVSLFVEMDNDYMKERAADIKDISKRIQNVLKGKKSIGLAQLDEEVIVAARDLTPSDTAQMNAEKVLGILTEQGGKTSHSAIIARSLGIPAIVGVSGLMEQIHVEEVAAFDGESGEIYLKPSKEVLQNYVEKKRGQEEQKKRLNHLKGTKSVTVDGHSVEIAGNIGSKNDLPSVMEYDAEGIGLFRTEFLYMNRENFPTEEEQFESYKTVAETMKRKSVIIRTLDIGGDKALRYLDIPKEENPFLGYRAIRLCLDRKKLFKTQLRAILKASTYGNIKMMFPMICTLRELREAKLILDEVKEELKNEEVPFNNEMEVGVMIETPGAALISEELAKEADFFSIGTNDLIQYTMAVDRLNTKVSYLYSFYQPAVLRLIQKVVENGHKQGIWIGMCGEAARELQLVPLWIGMGFDELSMSASSILLVREKVQKLSYNEVKTMVNEVLSLSTDKEVESYLSIR